MPHRASDARERGRDSCQCQWSVETESFAVHRSRSHSAHHCPKSQSKSPLPFVLQSVKILFSCEDFSENSFASVINRPRARARTPHRQSAAAWADFVLILGSFRLSSA